jgi:hypothetical protein
MPFLYFDFEYRHPDKRNEVVLLSWSTSENTAPKTFDLRDGTGTDELRRIYDTHRTFIWVAYNAHADLRSSWLPFSSARVNKGLPILLAAKQRLRPVGPRGLDL